MQRKTTLWRIPAFGIVAGVLCFFLNSHFLGSLALVTLPDGTVTVDPLRALLLDGLIFLITLGYCALWVTPKMTRKETFHSALLLVGFLLVSVGIQAVLSGMGSGAGAMAAFYLAEPFEWCSVVGQLVLLLTDNQWAAMLIQCLSPLAFVPLAKKTLPDYREQV